MARKFGTNRNGGSFDEATIDAVWQKGTPEAGLATYRKDKCGASMLRGRHGVTEMYGWEIDHIVPVSLGGGDELSNLRPLQWENNRAKSDKLDGSWVCAKTS